jgi:hypothetical protein
MDLRTTHHLADSCVVAYHFLVLALNTIMAQWKLQPVKYSAVQEWPKEFGKHKRIKEDPMQLGFLAGTLRSLVGLRTVCRMD